MGSDDKRSKGTAIFLAFLILVSLLPAAGTTYGFEIQNGVKSPDKISNEKAVVVDDDGDADYTTIEGAIDNAADISTIKVRPGTYDSINVWRSVDLIAPQGAVINGSGNGIGIYIGASDVTVEGFTVSNFDTGIGGANPPSGETGLTIRNVTLINNGVGVDSRFSLIVNSTVENTRYDGISPAFRSNDWVVKNTVITGSGSPAIDAQQSTGNWKILNTTLKDNHGGVHATRTNGSWVIANSTIVNNDIFGIWAPESRGNWTVRSTIIRNISEPSVNRGIGINARHTTGRWKVHSSIIHSNL